MRREGDDEFRSRIEDRIAAQLATAQAAAISEVRVLLACPEALESVRSEVGLDLPREWVIVYWALRRAGLWLQPPAMRN